MTTETLSLDVDAVMRAYGFKRQQCPVGNLLSTTYAEQWVGLLDDGFEVVPLQCAPDFAKSLIMRN